MNILIKLQTQYVHIMNNIWSIYDHDNDILMKIYLIDHDWIRCWLILLWHIRLSFDIVDNKNLWLLYRNFGCKRNNNEDDNDDDVNENNLAENLHMIFKKKNFSYFFLNNYKITSI